MENSTAKSDIVHDTPQRPPWRNIMLLVGLILLGMSLGNLTAILAIILISSIDEPLSAAQIPLMLQNPQHFRHAWWYLMLLQSISHIFSFLIPGLMYWRWSEQHHVENFIKRPLPPAATIWLSVMVVFVFMPFNSWVIEWNSQLDLPSVLQPLEQWMSDKEAELARMTDFLTSFDTWGQLVVAIGVIAVIPAFGEEVLFRGVIQRKIFHKIPNSHVAVWLTAALFSAIHLQFYGFVPRLLLGVLFGYLYMWTRTLWIPIIAHFVNNAATVFILFLNHRGVVNFDIEHTENMIPWVGVLLSLVATIGLLALIKNRPLSSVSTPYGT
ncbi:MAG: lysostaphin resistance A-like protein [Runella sp.]